MPNSRDEIKNECVHGRQETGILRVVTQRRMQFLCLVVLIVLSNEIVQKNTSDCAKYKYTGRTRYKQGQKTIRS